MKVKLKKKHIGYNKILVEIIGKEEDRIDQFHSFWNWKATSGELHSINDISSYFFY